MAWQYLLLAPLLQVCAVQQEAKLLPSQAPGGAQFGHALDLQGDRLVVGAPWEKNPNTGGLRGLAYVFERSGSAWIQQALLADTKGGISPDSAKFGSSVSLDGDRIAVGAPGATVSAYASGKVFIFRRLGTGWIEEAILDSPGYPPTGSSLALEGNTLLAGAPALYQNGNWNKPTVVYEYIRGPSGWSLNSVISPPVPAPHHDRFGWSVILRGDTAFISSPGNPNLFPPMATGGEVFVYKRIGATWTLQQTLAPRPDLGADDVAPGGFFGGSLAFDGSTLIVGAYGMEFDTGLKTWIEVGRSYVFTQSGSLWIQRAELVPKGFTPGGQSGRSVALSGDSLVLGTNGGVDSVIGGVYYLFTGSGSQWTEHLKIAPDDGGAADNFGSVLAVAGDTLAVAAERHDAVASDAGAVYIYRIDTSSLVQSFYCSPKVVPPCTPRISHIGQASISGAASGKQYRVFAWEVSTSVQGMLLYSINGAANLPFNGGMLCLKTPIVRSGLVQALPGTTPCYNWMSTDFNAHIQSGVDPALTAGQQVWFQWWYREPAFPAPNNIGLTDGLTAIICQ